MTYPRKSLGSRHGEEITSFLSSPKMLGLGTPDSCILSNLAKFNFWVSRFRCAQITSQITCLGLTISNVLKPFSRVHMLYYICSDIYGVFRQNIQVVGYGQINPLLKDLSKSSSKTRLTVWLKIHPPLTSYCSRQTLFMLDLQKLHIVLLSCHEFLFMYQKVPYQIEFQVSFYVG
jgi:hypothetical protein